METPRAPSFDIAQGPTLVEPTTRGRIPVYDFVRGVAILGILLANIPWFALPEFGDMIAMRSSATGADAEVERWTLAFVTGKFRSMLAILFGVGIWLQFQKRSPIAGNWPGGYLKRVLILAAFGIFHGIFIWHGDILFMYACVALVACLFVNIEERVLRWIICAIVILAVLAAAGLLAVGALAGGDMGSAGPNDFNFGITAADEHRAFANGTYFDQVALRAPMFAMMAMGVVFFLPFLGALFLLGILLARHGVLAAPSQFPRVRNAMLWIGLGIGLPLNLVAAFLTGGEGSFFVESAVEVCFGPLMSVGLVMGLAVAAEQGLFRAARQAVAAVGRTAFSNYILQSLLCTFFFYSWGLGYFGKLDRAQMLGVVAGVWIANLLFAHSWLRWFRMGPIEWLWRSWTEGRRLPLGKEAG